MVNETPGLTVSTTQPVPSSVKVGLPVGRTIDPTSPDTQLASRTVAELRVNVQESMRLELVTVKAPIPSCTVPSGLMPSVPSGRAALAPVMVALAVAQVSPLLALLPPGRT